MDSASSQPSVNPLPVAQQKTRNVRKFQGPSQQQRELVAIRDLCLNLEKMAESQRLEAIYRRNQDYMSLKEMTENFKNQDEISLLEMEASMSIINIGLRKQALRGQLVKKLTDEKELSNLMQNHREDFMQFIWKRRLQTRRDQRLLFQNGPGMIGRLGDIISDSSIDALQAFERNNNARLCKEAIHSGLVDNDEIPLYFNNKVSLAPPRNYPRLVVQPSMTEFGLLPLVEGQTLDDSTWHCIYCNRGTWAMKLFATTFHKEIIDQTFLQIKNARDGDSYSYVYLLARMADLIHPTHQLQATALAFPLYGPQILKRRLSGLGYELGNNPEDNGPIDYKLALDIVSQMHDRLERQVRSYFEITFPTKLDWIGGLTTARRMKSDDFNRYPGIDSYSFGFGVDGYIYFDSTRYTYTEDLRRSPGFSTLRTVGIVTDMQVGFVALVVDGKMLPPAFGWGAGSFDEEEQDRQRGIIRRNMLIPTFGVKDYMKTPEELPTIRLNFGEKPFVYNTLNVSPVNQLLLPQQSRALDHVSILEAAGGGKDKLSQEEDEKIHNTLEKNYFRVNLIPDSHKGFSQFPPSVYRKSFAATRIQRAWRRHVGRKMRERIRKEQYEAAVIIQRMARKKLRKIRELKNDAASRIQKFWRRKKFIWIALLRCIYQQPIPEMHRAAKVIQTTWRKWHLYKNSPLASKYQTRPEELEAAVNKIIRWWRIMHSKMGELRERRKKIKAAITIQRYWRGHYLRQLLRPELREKLRRIGTALCKSKDLLLRVRAAYIIQRTWRKVLQRRIRAEKVKTRHRACARIQAVWRGYWVRSHTILRFTYGQAVFITAVCKALRQCHFILKMYKPCGIVCPRNEYHSRD